MNTTRNVLLLVVAIAATATFLVVLAAFLMWRGQVAQAEYDERYQACMTVTAPTMDIDNLEPYALAADACHERAAAG